METNGDITSGYIGILSSDFDNNDSTQATNGNATETSVTNNACHQIYQGKRKFILLYQQDMTII